MLAMSELNLLRRIEFPPAMIAGGPVGPLLRLSLRKLDYRI